MYKPLFSYNSWSTFWKKTRYHTVNTSVLISFLMKQGFQVEIICDNGYIKCVATKRHCKISNVGKNIRTVLGKVVLDFLEGEDHYNGCKQV